MENHRLDDPDQIGKMVEMQRINSLIEVIFHCVIGKNEIELLSLRT